MSRFEGDEIVEAWALEEHHSRSGASAARAVRLTMPVESGWRHAVGLSGGCSSTSGRYSTSWMRPSKVRLSIMSRATSG